MISVKTAYKTFLFRFIAFAFVVLTVDLCAILATDYYVDNLGGDDRNSGTAPSGSGTGLAPFKTIARALRSVDGGDRVILKKNDVPYKESITLQGARCSGNGVGPFELIGNGATLDGSAELSPDVWKHVSGNIFKFRPRRSTNQILFRDSVPLVRNRSNNPASLELHEWALVDGEIYFRVDEGNLPENYLLSICGHRTGITLYQVHDVVISDLVVQGFQLDGVNAHDLVTRSQIHSSTLRGNGRSGLSVGCASRFEMISCLLGNNGVAQMRIEGFSRLNIRDCDLVEDDHTLRIDFDGGKLTQDDQPVSHDLK